MEHFRRYGRIVTDGADLFGPASWLAVQIGQMHNPQRHDPLVDLRPVDGKSILLQIHAAMQVAANEMPGHAEFITQYCRGDVVSPMGSKP